MKKQDDQEVIKNVRSSSKMRKFGPVKAEICPKESSKCHEIIDREFEYIPIIREKSSM